jgi:hypothetical protein
MKTAEFITYMSKNTNKTMKDEQVISVARKVTEAKSYLGIKDKKQLVDDIIKSCIIYEDGIFKIDGIEKYIQFTMKTLAAYTNLEFGADIEEDFDALSRERLLPVLVCMIQQEYDDVNILLQTQCDFILEDNTIEAQLGRFFNAVLDKTDSMQDVIKNAVPELVKKLDIKSIMAHKDDILKFLNNMNK